MPVVVTFVLFLFWIVLAYRQFQRGDMLLAGIFLLVGVVLTVYRYRAAMRRSEQALTPKP